MDHQVSRLLAAESDFQGLVPAQTTEFELVTPVDPESRSYRAQTTWLARVFLAATTGGLAIIGHGTFAGSNFLVNVLLARWLTADQYGAFALAYAGFLLFLMLYSACVYEPLIVFGSGKYAGRFHEYFGLLARGSVLVLAALSCLMLASLFLLSRFFPSGVERDFAGLSLAAPFVLLTWL